MEVVKKLNKWANSHTYVPLDILRIALGVFLFLKGVHFMVNTEYIIELLKPADVQFANLILIHYVAMFHIAGGILVAFGMVTRIALLAQLPILFGAVLVNFTSIFILPEFIQSLLALLISSFFVVYGSGKHSVDYGLKLGL